MSESKDTEQAAKPERKAPKRNRDTSLPPGHEILEAKAPEGEGVPVDNKMAIEAIRAAFSGPKPQRLAPDQPRGRLDVPQEGDADYEFAQWAQKAAQEVLAAAEGIDPDSSEQKADTEDSSDKE